MELPLRKTFFPLGYPVEIITNDNAVLQAATESFGHARLSHTTEALQVRVGVSPGGDSGCSPEPIRREYSHLYSLVADANNQAILDLRSGINFIWVTSVAANNTTYFRYNFLEKAVYLLLGASVVTDLHAACISKCGKGVLLMGDSGAGKSTLAYGCARAGWTYTSDDTSSLINDSIVPRVIGHAHRVRFRPTAQALFPELQSFALTPRLEGKPSIEVPISDLPVAATAPEVNVTSIVYLNRIPSAAGSLVRLPNGTATQRACRELYSAGEIRAKHESLLQVLYDIPTYELKYSNLDQAVHALDLLSSSE
jgi:hypothetical protein